MLNLSWLLNNRKNFVNFVTILGETSSNQIYETELISTLLSEFWEENYTKILTRCLLPWLAYGLCLLAFLTMALTEHDEGTNGHGKILFAGFATICFLIY